MLFCSVSLGLRSLDLCLSVHHALCVALAGLAGHFNARRRPVKKRTGRDLVRH